MPEPHLPKRAVALRYRSEHEPAPRIVGPVAERILAAARAAGVPLHEDRDLVQLLAALEIDAVVPPSLYFALAEVLAHLYRANVRES
jgi:flagellar biosynthesis protein